MSFNTNTVLLRLNTLNLWKFTKINFINSEIFYLYLKYFLIKYKIHLVYYKIIYIKKFSLLQIFFYKIKKKINKIQNIVNYTKPFFKNKFYYNKIYLKSLIQNKKINFFVFSNIMLKNKLVYKQISLLNFCNLLKNAKIKFKNTKKKIMKFSIFSNLNLKLNFIILWKNIKKIKYISTIFKQINMFFWYFKFYSLNNLYFSILLTRLFQDTKFLGDVLQILFKNIKNHVFFLKNFLNIWKIINRNYNLQMIISGKWFGLMRARKKILYYGHVAKLNFNVKVDTTTESIITKYGIFNIKIWIIK
jgi:hypothetical protein